MIFPSVIKKKVKSELSSNSMTALSLLRLCFNFKFVVGAWPGMRAAWRQSGEVPER